jgi:predicted transcriptional regulator
MDKKIILLDSLSDGLMVGESEQEILKYFKISDVEITVDELNKLLTELLTQKLIIISKANDFNNNPMYIMTEKGKYVLLEAYKDVNNVLKMY